MLIPCQWSYTIDIAWHCEPTSRKVGHKYPEIILKGPDHLQKKYLKKIINVMQCPKKLVKLHMEDFFFI